MKKVGILSMQRIANYGSFLQAYGLKHMLEEFDCDVQFVDYHPGKTLIPENSDTGIKRKITKALESFKCKAPFWETLKFIRYKKNFGSNYFTYLGLGEMNYSPNLDVLVIGSDEVFNCVQSNINVGFSPELFGANNNAKKVVTYAASFGNTTFDMLEKYGIREEVASLLNAIDSISVRDKNSGKIVNTLTGRVPHYDLDPVLIYNYIDKCNKIPSSVSDNNYMILYGYSGRFNKEECRKIRQFATTKGLKIYCIGGIQESCDKFIDCDPFKVIAYFQHADYIVTDTFHGTIFSIITHKPFVSFVRKLGYGNFEKISDLLERVKLEDRAIYCLDELDVKIDSYINYEQVDEIIKKERNRSFEYLQTFLNIN